MKKIITLIFTVLLISCGTVNAQIENVNISDGFIDRAFDRERTLYYVDAISAEIPEISADGATVVQKATGTSWNNLEERITILKDGETGKEYRFVIRPKAEKVDILSFAINQAGELTLEYSAESSEYLNLLILKPLSDEADKSFETTDVGDTDDGSKVLAIAELGGGNGKFTYKLPDDAITGMYTAIVGGDKIATANRAKASTYYISKNAFGDILKKLNAISGNNEAEIIRNLDDFIGRYYIALNIDKEKYDSISDKSLFVKYLIGQDFADLDEVMTNYNTAMTLSEINEATESDIINIVEKSKDILNVDLEIYKEIDDLSNVAKILKEKKYDSIDAFNSFFYETVSLVYINESTPSEIQGRFEKVRNILIKDSGIDKKYDDCKNKTMVLKSIVNKDFKNINDFLAAFQKAIEESNKPATETKPSKSGSSNGGGVGGVYIPAVKDETKFEPDDEKNTETKDELYDDIEDVEWAREAILTLSDRKIVNGKADKKFAPNDKVKREEFLKMLVEAFRLKSNNSTVGFSDVSEKDWYYDYILIGVGNNIIKGKSENTFGVNENITREDMAVMTVRAIDAAKISIDDKVKNLYYNLNFKDADDISEYARESVEKLFVKGLISGVGEDLYAPKGFATRAQAAQMIYNIIKDS